MAARTPSRAVGGLDATAILFVFGALAAGCKADPPDALRWLPTDAEVVASVDVDELAAWEGLKGPGPLAAFDLPAQLEGVADCGVDLDDARLLFAARPGSMVIVVEAESIGEELACIGRGEWRDGAAPWFSVDDEGKFSVGAFTGRAMSDDVLLLASGEHADEHDALFSQDAGPSGESMTRLLGQVDHRDTAWIVAAPSVAIDGVFADITGLRVGMDLDGDELELDATVWAADETTAEALEEAMPARLSEIAKWVYASPTLVEDAEIQRKEATVDLAVELPLAQWRTLDLRFVAERRQVSPAEDRGKAEPESGLLADAISFDRGPSVDDSASIAVALKAEPAVPELTGVTECDQYLADYRKCIDEKIPEAAREVSRRALETSADAWRKAAVYPAGRESLAEACKIAHDAVAPSCGW